MQSFSTPEQVYSFLTKQTTYKTHRKRIQSVDEILLSKELDCWETVEFQRYFLSQMNSVKNIRTYAMGFYMKKDYEYDGKIYAKFIPRNNHTVILFEYKNKVCHMETSWRTYACFKVFSNWNTAVNFVVKRYFNNIGEFENLSTSQYIRKYKLKSFQVYQYKDIKEHATDKEFLDQVVSGKLIYETDL